MGGSVTHFGSLILIAMVLSEIDVQACATVVRQVSTYLALQYSHKKSQVSVKIIGSSST